MGAQVEDERNNVSTSDKKGREILVRVENLGGEPPFLLLLLLLLLPSCIFRMALLSKTSRNKVTHPVSIVLLRMHAGVILSFYITGRWCTTTTSSSRAPSWMPWTLATSLVRCHANCP